MRRERSKQLRKLAVKNSGKSSSTHFRRKDGSLAIPGDSIQGGYIKLKKWYMEEKREGNKPWLKLKKELALT